MALLKKKWFYPLAVAYIVFGIWFGSFNYKVFTNQQDYGYTTRFVLYPMTTAWRDGWLCVSKNPFAGQCYIGPRGENVLGTVVPSPIDALRVFNFPNARATYVASLAVSWPLKIIANAVTIILLFVAPFVTIFILFIALVFMFLAGLIVFLVSLLL